MAKIVKNRVAVAAERLVVPEEFDPKLEALVREIIERVADKWTMLVLEVLEEHGTVRFTQLGRLVGGISQKMLTQTLRAMERDGLVVRTVHPVVPPKVEYRLTRKGRTFVPIVAAIKDWGTRHLAEASASEMVAAE